jgi:threonine/homoserine/homoserine lactone efflux protein
MGLRAAINVVLGWPVAVTTPWGTRMIPVWLNWIACAAAILLAWLGYTASRSESGIKPVVGRTARQGPAARQPLVRLSSRRPYP